MFSKRCSIQTGIILTGILLMLAGCGSSGKEKDTKNQADQAESVSENLHEDMSEDMSEDGLPEEENGSMSDDGLTVTDTASSQPVYTLEPGDTAMVAIGGTLYIDSQVTADEPDSSETADNGAGIITSTVESGAVPSNHGQSNFGTGFAYRVMNDQTVRILIDDQWHVFRRLGSGSVTVDTPPAITLVDPLNDRLNGMNYNAVTYSWTYRDGVQTLTAKEEGIEPLDSDVLMVKPLRVPYYNGMDSVAFTMGCETDPDSVRVTGYSIYDVGIDITGAEKVDTESEEAPADTAANTGTDSAADSGSTESSDNISQESGEADNISQESGEADNTSVGSATDTAQKEEEQEEQEEYLVQPVSVDEYEAPYFINLKNAMVYEIRAEWDENKLEERGFCGTAVYLVVTGS